MSSPFPGWLRGTWLESYVLDFEARIARAVAGLARDLKEGARVLDAGAGEGRYRGYFRQQLYVGVDLAIGDPEWDYTGLDVIADLRRLPFRDGVFDACLNIVTLEHIPEPEIALAEMARVLAEGGKLLLVVPQEWELHQAPHDYYRFTRHGVEHLIRRAGLAPVEIVAAGGFFRLLGRRLLNALQFFPGPLKVLAGLLLVPAGLAAPLLDWLDRERHFTLGYICVAQKRI